ncbi:MAG: SDR family oxidoreductase [Candidatus Binataceae bacterium]
MKRNRLRIPKPSGAGRSKIAAPVVLITGAGRGIGRATATAFAAEGYAVAIAEQRAALGRASARAITKNGAAAIFVRTNVADSASVGQCVRATLRYFGRVDCLVNNAGVARIGPFADLRVRDLDAMLGVNLRGPLLMSRAVLPIMLRQGSGSIVNVSSRLGKAGRGQYVTYCASKFGVVGLTEALADELAGTGIKVWAVCPGLVDTAAARAAGISATAMRSALKPEQVADAIVKLATGHKRAPSGAAVDVA